MAEHDDEPQEQPADEPTRYFSVTEANALVPRLQTLFGEIQAARERIVAGQPALWPVLKKSALNGGNAEAGALLQDFERIKRAVHEIQSLGATVKDLNSGLVDFPAEREGRVVYLCWQYGEDQVAFWHDLETGFTGRQPL